MIYVPDTSYKCYVIINSDTIRSYEQVPYNPGYNQNISINYRDYYLNSNYIYMDGSQNFGNYSTIPTCLDKSVITDSVYYRNDFDSILIIFLIMSIFIFYIPIKVFLRFFRRFQ